MLMRSGSCNRCGQCCGAISSPSPTNPWPRPWARGALQEWADDTLPSIVRLVGEPVRSGVNSAILLDNKTYRVLWTDDGLCKDASPWGDDSAYSPECPFLMDDPGNSTRPCALVGTNLENIWTEMCQPEPPLEKTAAQVGKWQMRHPNCSYTWE